MFTLNFCMLVKSDPYAPREWKDLVIDVAPAFFISRDIRNTALTMHTEYKRISALRDMRLHRAVRLVEHGLDDPEIDLISDFMKDVAGRDMTEEDMEIVGKATMALCPKLERVLEQELWRGYPDSPPASGNSTRLSSAP